MSESCRKLGSFVAYTTAAIACRLDALKQSDPTTPEPDDLLGNKGRTSGRDARTAARRGKTLGQLPGVGSQLANGDISAEHLDAAAAAQHGLTDAEKQTFASHDAELASKARQLSPEDFRKHCGRLAEEIANDRGENRLEKQRRDSFFKSWLDPANGMVRLSGALDPIRGETVLNALNSLTDSLINAAKDDPIGGGLGFAPLGSEPIRREQYAAQALTLLASSALAGAGRADVTVIADAETLANGFHDHSVAETAIGTPIPPATLSRLCCGATLQAVRVDPLTGALDVGRRHRVATQAQRAVLRALHDTCAVARCDTPFEQCHVHHILEWESGGPTDLANLIPLCWRHHHLVHEGGWHLMHSVSRPGSLFLTDTAGAVQADCRPTRLADWQAAKARLAKERSGRAWSTKDPPAATGAPVSDASVSDASASKEPASASGAPPSKEPASREPASGAARPKPRRLVRNRATEQERANNARG